MGKSTKTTKGTKQPKAIAALLETIASKEKWLVPHLAPGASPEALSKLKALGAPPTMLALYAAHDGTEAATYRGYPLFSVERILEERAAMNKILAERADWREQHVWDESWLPFMGEDGQLVCVDPKGTCEGSAVKGQVLFYDHETGASRELASFDVFVDLLTALAKAKLLDPEAQEENPDKYEGLCDRAARVGAAMMPAKEMKALNRKLDGEDPPSESARLELLLPLARKYSADGDLWRKLAHTAVRLDQWKLAVEGASKAMRLASRDRKNDLVSPLVVGLHRTGADDKALAVLREAAARQTNYLTSLVEASELSTELTVRAYQVLLEVHPKSTPVWLALAKVASGEVRRKAAEQVIALLFAPDARMPSADEAIAAKQLLDEGLSLTEKAKSFAAFVPSRKSKAPIAEEHWQFSEPFARVALAAGDWQGVLDAAEAGRIDKVLSDPTKVRLVVRARFELGDEAGALGELKRSAKAIAKDDELDVAKGLQLLPWDIFPTLPLAPGMLMDTPLLREPLDLANARPEQVRFQRACLEELAKLQRDEPYWKYGLASTVEAEPRAEQLRELLELDFMKAPSDGKPSAWDDEAKARFQLRLRVLLDVGEADQALALVKQVAATEESSYDAERVVPFLASEVARLPEPLRRWAAEAYWCLGQTPNPTFDVLVAAARYSDDPARRREALERLVETTRPAPSKRGPDVLDFRAQVEALFECDREDEALAVVKESLKHAPSDGESRLPLAVPFQKDYLDRTLFDDGPISMRTREAHEAFLERWYGTIATTHTHDAAVWVTRAALSADPKRKEAWLAEAEKRVAHEPRERRTKLRRSIFEARVGEARGRSAR